MISRQIVMLKMMNEHNNRVQGALPGTTFTRVIGIQRSWLSDKVAAQRILRRARDAVIQV